MESTLRRTWANIHLDALAYNYHKIREHMGAGVKFLGIVKADAYGHGAVRVAQKLQELGANYLAVSSIDEAMELRIAGILLPLLILGHTPKEQVERLICFDITQAVSCDAKAKEYNEEAKKCGKKLKVHLKVDTGMSRLGYICEGDYFDTGIEALKSAATLENLEIEGIFTHFARADEKNEEARAYTLKQFDLFMTVVKKLENELKSTFKYVHCANSGASVLYPQTRLSMIRAGILLYGYGKQAKELGLKPLMELKTCISTIKIYPANTKISYGGAYTTIKSERIAVLPCGYADGFMRCLSNKIQLATKFGFAPIRGKICMDMSMIDISTLPDLKVGDEIEIFGKQNAIEDVANLANTIPYELTCAVSKRVPRIFIENEEVVARELSLRM